MVHVATDEYKDKKLLTPGQSEWLEMHSSEFWRWMDENLKSSIDKYELEADVLYNRDPIKAYLIYLYLNQEIMGNWEKIEKVCENIAKRDGSLTIIIAPKRFGKTALMYFLAEHIHKKYKMPVWWYGPPASLPPFIENYTLDYNKLPQDVLVLADELALKFFNRNAMDKTQKDIMRQLPVASHTGRNILATIQDANIADIQVLRMATAFIFLGKSVVSLRRQRLIFDTHLHYFFPNKQGQALFFDGFSLLDFNFELPKWWNDEYSKPFRKFRSKAEEYTYTLLMLKEGCDNKTICDYLSMRATFKEEADIEFMRRFADYYGLAKLLELPASKLEDIMEMGYSDNTINEILAGKRQKNRYNFQQNPILKKYWQNKFEKDEDQQVTLKTNVNKIIIDYIKNTKAHDHCMISVTGLTGSGKSLASLSLAECIAKILNIPFKLHIFTTTDQLLQALPGVKRHETVILDEQIKRMGLGSGIESTEMSNVEQTLRAEQINFIFNAPKLHTHLHRFILEPYSVDEANNVIKLIVFLPDMSVFGHITLSRPSEKTEKEYIETIKQPFTKAVKERETKILTTGASYLQDNSSKVLKKYPEWHSFKVDQKLAAIVDSVGCGFDNAKLIRAMLELAQNKSDT